MFRHRSCRIDGIVGEIIDCGIEAVFVGKMKPELSAVFYDLFVEQKEVTNSDCPTE
jgi:hypothetical protein